MTTYTFTPNGLLNKATGEVEPFNRDAPVCLPQLMRGDEQEPLLSMADGKMYTSKAAMRASYKASGNPQGKEYVEVGDDPSYLNPRVERNLGTKEDVAVSVAKAEAAISRGEFDHIQ